MKPICVGLEPADLARLDALATGQRMNRSALVRRAIKNLLASYNGQNAGKKGN